MDRFNNENNLYGGYKKDKVKIEDTIEIKTTENNILMDSSIQRVMKKNRDLQKQINQLLEENSDLKNSNSKLERQVTKLRNRN